MYTMLLIHFAFQHLSRISHTSLTVKKVRALRHFRPTTSSAARDVGPPRSKRCHGKSISLRQKVRPQRGKAGRLPRCSEWSTHRLQRRHRLT